MKYKVAICDAIDEAGLKILEDAKLEIKDLSEIPKEELVKHVKDVNVLIVRSATKVTRELIDAIPNLKIIARAGVGVDNIDVDYASSKGITVINAPESSTESVAELTILHMLNCARNYTYAVVSTKEGKWEKSKLMGFELANKTLGIMGFGRIGRRVAELALAFKMKVLVYDPYVKSSDLPVKFVDKEELLRSADIITLHVPLTKETYHMISSKEFELMKDGAILINTSRGGVVDEDALYDALREGKVRYACLDVFEEEPPKDCKLLDLPNLFATPHIGAQTKEAQKRASVEICKKIVELLKNGV